MTRDEAIATLCRLARGKRVTKSERLEALDVLEEKPVKTAPAPLKAETADT